MSYQYIETLSDDEAVGTHADEYAQWRYTRTKTNTNPNPNWYWQALKRLSLNNNCLQGNPQQWVLGSDRYLLPQQRAYTPALQLGALNDVGSRRH